MKFDLAIRSIRDSVCWSGWMQVVVLVVFASAVLLRVAILERQGLWADEVFSLAMATGHSLEHPAAVSDPRRGDFVEHPRPVPAAAYRAYLEHDAPAAGLHRVVRAVFLSDTSPPLYYVVLYGWTRAVGTSDVAVRLFSVLWALACLPLLWFLGRKLGGRSAAAIACALFAFAPIAIRYSTEGRMYAMLWFLVLLTVWTALRIYRSGATGPLLLLWTLVSAAGFLTHYFYAFVWTAAFVWLLWQPGRADRRLVLLGAACVGVLIFPWYSQIPASLAGWRVTQDWLTWEPRRYRALNTPFELAWSYFSARAWGTRSVLNKKQILLMLLVVLPVLAMIDWRRRGRHALLLLLCVCAACLGPLAFDALRGTYASAISRYALAGMPAAFLLLAMGLARMPVPIRALAVAGLLVVWLPGIRDLYVHGSRSGSPYRQLGAVVSERGDSSDLVLVHAIPSGVIGVARYMETDVPVAAWVGQLGQRRVPEDVHALAAGRRHVILVKTSTVGASAPQEAYLRETAVTVDEAKVLSSTVVTFAPRGEAFFPSHDASAPFADARPEEDIAAEPDHLERVSVRER